MIVGPMAGPALVDSELKVLIFHVGGERHAALLGDVAGVAHVDEIRPMPQPPRFVIGMIDRGAEPIPVYDLAAILDLPSGQNRHVILHQGTNGVVGFVVEQAAAVGAAQLRELPEPMRRPGAAVTALADVHGAPAFMIDLDLAIL